MGLVWKFSDAPATDRLVLLAIADCANDDGDNAFPANSTLAAKTKLDVRTVQRCVGRLVEMGELEVRLNAGPKGTNRYRVLLDDHGKTGSSSAQPPGNLSPRHSATPGAEYADPRQNATPTPGTAPDEPSLTRPEPSLACTPVDDEEHLDPDDDPIRSLHLALNAVAIHVAPPSAPEARALLRGLIDRKGEPALVKSALAQCKLSGQPVWMTAFMQIWDRLADQPPPAGTVRCDAHGRQMPCWQCRDDELISRDRDTETAAV